MTASSALVPVSGTVLDLDTEWPEARFNRLIPTKTIQMPTDLLVPVFQIVQLEPADREGKSPDHYKSVDVPQGKRALTARGISKLADVASVSFVDEHRTDDGSDPDVMGVAITARMMMPNGMPRSAPGSQLINIRTWFGSQTSAAELAKFRKQFYAHVATRARNRAMRALLSLQQSYSDAEIAKPFVVVSYAPNLNHPAIRDAFVAAIVPAITAGFGPAAAREITAGREIVEAEAPEEPSPAALGSGSGTTQPPTAIAAAHEDDPFGAAPVATTQSGTSGDALVQVLRQKAGKSGLTGGATEPQKNELRNVVVRPLGLDVFTAGLKAIFDVAPDPADGKLYLSAAQAQVLVEVAKAHDFEDFTAQWRAAAGLAA